ncbi:MAG: hypothetical protein R2729_19660 [Bryobacteraceae bacterium]
MPGPFARPQFLTGCLVVAMAWCAEPPKAKVSDYPAYAELSKLALGGEYNGSSAFGRRDTYYLKNYLVVDVAIYPKPRTVLRVSIGQFRLRVNGKKIIEPQPPGMAALTVNDPRWGTAPRFEQGGAIGPVVLGPPRRAPLPGDPTGTDPRNRAPIPRPVENEDRSGVERERPEPMQDVVRGEALIEGPVEQAVRGYLYFPYSGKLKSVKKVELIFDDHAESATLTLP